MYTLTLFPFFILVHVFFSGSVFVLADTLQTIDDRDLRMQYSGGWTMEGGPYEYDSSTMLTQTSGASASLTFTGSY